jgi:acyl-coenzyme A thioesterase PaaI-like protein
MAMLIGTADGVHALDGDGSTVLAGHRIDGLARGDGSWWVLSDGETVWNIPDGGTPSRVAGIDDTTINCLLSRRDDVLLGATAAQLFHIPAAAEPGADPTLDESFEQAPGRSDWYTPWGGPPDVRSLAEDADGSVYLNVHVGGILRYREDDPIWRDTMDINADVHEVIAHPEAPNTALAATARGLAISRDGAANWGFHTDGLHARYCRAVAVSGDRVYVSASRSNRGEIAAVYRTDLTGSHLERCESGLPEWFSTNINTGCLQAAGDLVLIGDADGTVYRSNDAGKQWVVAAEGLPSVRCVGLG